MVSIAGLVIADVLGSRRGIQDADALNRIRIIGAVVGATPLGIIVSDFVAQREAQSSVVAPTTTTTIPSGTTQTMVQVPGVTGIAFDSAQKLLQSYGLQAQRQDVIGSPTAKDEVINQNPPMGEIVPTGTTVTLGVSLGVVVPNVRNLPLADAAIQLQASGLQMQSENERSSTVSKDAVIRQDPPPDSKVSWGSTVTLIVSLGANVTVPNVVNTPVDSARAKLQDSGLQTGLAYETSDSINKGFVIKSNPPAETSVAFGTTVTLTVSTAQDFEIPNVTGILYKDAHKKLVDLKLHVKREDQNSDATREGYVIRQDLPGKTSVSPGSVVTLIVSKGVPVVDLPPLIGMPFTLDGKPHYLAYNAATGEVAIDRIKPDGKGVDTIWGTPLDASLKWAPGWTTIMPFKMDDKPHYFAYNASNGWVSVGSIAEELRRCVSPGVSRDDPTALNLSPIGTDDFNVTLTVRGTSYQVKGNVFYPGQSNGARVHFNTSAVPGGKAPIVFIAHGNHGLFHNPANRLDERGTNPGGFVPILNHKGYEYFQQLLAQMGIISVSVDCNQFSGFIGSSPKNMNDRADLVLGAIKHFQSLNSGSDPTFGSHIDFSRVGLMGHSRGGEVVLLVPELLALSSTGISGVTVKGVISVAPTDVGATSGKPRGFAFMTILPAADLDVITNHGAKFYDQASSDPFNCQLYIHNANHNFFNTEWVSDDLREWNPGTSSLTTRRSNINVMDKDDEKAILKANGCVFFRTVLLGHNLRKFLEGLEIPPGVARFRDVHISFERTGSTTVDDNEDHDIDCNTLGRPNSKSGGLTANEYDFVRGSADVFNNTFYGHTRGMVARSSTASGRFRWDLVGSTDLTGREVRIRSAEVYDGASVPVGTTGFKLGLVDAAAKQAFVDSDSVGGLPRPYDRRADDLALFSNDFTKTMLTTLRFPISCFARAEPGFDPKQVRAITLLMDRHDGRALAFDQLQIV